ncbi:MAG: adenine deaminase C-terminal domain-containing protein [Halanaeroarchaeum sp.]
MQVDTVNEVQSVTLGRSPADVVVRGGRVLSPTTRSLTRRDVAIVGGRIAGLFDDSRAVVGTDTSIVDARDAVVAPGLVDAHTHLDLHQTVETSYHRMLAGGATSVVSEVAAFGPSFGADGVATFLDATADIPLRVYATVPPQPVFDMFEPAWADETERKALRALLERERVVGVGETAWPRIVDRDTPAEMLYDAAHAREKVVTGHGAGCRGDRLQAFATAVDDDHEAISGDGIRERVDAGIHAVGRFGTIRDDMDAIGEAYRDLDASELSLSTDGMWPRELVELGYMDAVLRRAVDAGVDPVDAVVMATVTPARHFGLEELGTLRAGTPADLVVFSDLETFEVETTMIGGEVVYDGGAPGEPMAPTYSYPDRFTDAVAVEVSTDDLVVPVEAGDDGRVLAIEYGGGLLTGHDTVEPPVRAGAFEADPPSLAKVALFDRHPERDGGGFVGFLTGFGLESGAIASSVTWETAGVVAVGTSDNDMLHAIGALEGMGGGWAVVDDGDVLATHPTPVGATCSRRPVEETARRYAAIEEAIGTLGVDGDRPMLGIQTLPFVGVPSLKLGFEGYADIRAGETVGLAPE